MKKVTAGFLSLVLAAGLCFSPEAVNVQAAVRASSPAMEVEREDREMQAHLRMEAQAQIPEKVKTSISPDGMRGRNWETEETENPVQFGADFGDGTFTDGACEENTDDGGIFSSGIEEDGETSFDDTPKQNSQEVKTEETEVNYGHVLTLQTYEGADITGMLNALLTEVKDYATDSRPCKIIIPPGNYRLTGTIFLYNNIHLYAQGAVLTKTSTDKHLLLKLGQSRQSAGGYNGYHNITIEGGIWDSNYQSVEGKDEPGGFVGFRIGHATNVTIKDATFLNNLKSHFIELGGVKDCRITGCTFRGYYRPYEKGGQEAIQIDSCMSGIMPETLPYDGTTCENIIIEGNTFEDVFAGVGSHSMMFDRPYRNIYIRNNTFRNITKRAVWCLNYQDSEVSGNVMENVGGGIYIRSLYSSNTHLMPGEIKDNTANQQSQNLVIRDNKIQMAKSGTIAGTYWRTFGVQVIGEDVRKSPSGVPDGIYTVKDVKITGNTISGPGNGIRLLLAESCEVSGNTITLSKPDKFKNLGVYLGGSSNNKIEKNTIEKAQSSGIYLYADKLASSGNTVNENTVTGGFADGVRVEAESDNTILTSNVSSKNQGSGISVKGADVTSLSKNKTFGNGDCGIFADHAGIKAQSENEMDGNGGAYAMFMNSCKGRPQNLPAINVSAKSAGVKKLTGQAAGAKSISVALKKNLTPIGNGKVSSKGNYSVSIKPQKKGTTLVITATDKYKNIVTQEHKTK